MKKINENDIKALETAETEINPVAPKIATVYCFMLPPLKVVAIARTPSRPDILAQFIQERGGHKTRPVETKPKRNAPL